MDIFVQLSPSNPNEAPLAGLLNHNLMEGLLQACNNFFLLVCVVIM